MTYMWAPSRTSKTWHTVAYKRGRAVAQCKYNLPLIIGVQAIAPPDGIKKCGKCLECIASNERNAADKRTTPNG